MESGCDGVVMVQEEGEMRGCDDVVICDGVGGVVIYVVVKIGTEKKKQYSN